jgi:alpha-N-arabinofuranosidase
MIDTVRYNQGIDHPIYVAYDEWNVWFRERDAESRLEEKYTLADALAVATYLNSFVRHCNTVKIANIAQMVNVIAPIFTNKEGLFLQTIYHPLRLFSEYVQGTALDIFVDSETFSFPTDAEQSPWPHRITDLQPFDLLDVTATCNESGTELTLAVVNRDAERAHSTTIQLGDNAALSSLVAYEVNGSHVDVVNSFANPHEVDVKEHRLDLSGHSFDYSFAPHSFTLLRLQLA